MSEEPKGDYVFEGYCLNCNKKVVTRVPFGVPARSFIFSLDCPFCGVSRERLELDRVVSKNVVV